MRECGDPEHRVSEPDPRSLGSDGRLRCGEGNTARGPNGTRTRRKANAVHRGAGNVQERARTGPPSGARTTHTTQGGGGREPAEVTRRQRHAPPQGERRHAPTTVVRRKCRGCAGAGRMAHTRVLAMDAIQQRCNPGLISSPGPGFTARTPHGTSTTPHGIHSSPSSLPSSSAP